jgi:hypothetical protein
MPKIPSAALWEFCETYSSLRESFASYMHLVQFYAQREVGRVLTLDCTPPLFCYTEIICHVTGKRSIFEFPEVPDVACLLL